MKILLVSFCVELNGEQHIQNPKKSTLRKIFYNQLKIICEKQHFRQSQL